MEERANNANERESEQCEREKEQSTKSFSLLDAPSSSFALTHAPASKHGRRVKIGATRQAQPVSNSSRRSEQTMRRENEQSTKSFRLLGAAIPPPVCSLLLCTHARSLRKDASDELRLTMYVKPNPTPITFGGNKRMMRMRTNGEFMKSLGRSFHLRTHAHSCTIARRTI